MRSSCGSSRRDSLDPRTVLIATVQPIPPQAGSGAEHRNAVLPTSQCGDPQGVSSPAESSRVASKLGFLGVSEGTILNSFYSRCRILPGGFKRDAAHRRPWRVALLLSNPARLPTEVPLLKLQQSVDRFRAPQSFAYVATEAGARLIAMAS